MLKEWITGCLAAGALLVVPSLFTPTHAAPAPRPELGASSDVTLVRRGGRGGGGIGRGSFGRSFGKGSFGRGGYGRGYSMRSGPKLGGIGRSRGVSRFAYRDRGPSFKGNYGRRHAGHHRHKHRRHAKFRRFPGLAFYGVPYAYYDLYDGGCGWLYRQATLTGLGYWWDRYYACLEGYDY